MLKPYFISLLCLFVFSIPKSWAETVKTGKITGGTELVFPEWFKESFLDFREDSAEAADGGKHLLLFFHVAGCPYCKKMLDDNFTSGDNAKIVQKYFDVIDLDLKGSKEIAFNKKLTVTETKLGQVLNVHYTPTLLFMSPTNNVVARIDGYRSPREFKQVLNFVKEKAYKTMDLATYREKHIDDMVYTLKDDPRYVKTLDLQPLLKQDKPLMVLFEDKTCDECARFHQEILDLKPTQKILDKYNVVRLDVLSDQAIIDPKGNKITAKKWLNQRNISYRPAVLLYSEGKEREKVTGLLKSFHFQQLLNYVADKKYNDFDTWIGYLNEQTKKILESGQNIDIWK
ncbi:MAG: thioredoxin fold domain-containing protein [Cocleimonas sp.]|nr:thioredoxin fold domain-containing protein [Cocleimonas sp.]